MQGSTGEAGGVSFEPSPEMLAQQEEASGISDPRVREAKEALAEAIRQDLYGRAPGPRTEESLSGAAMIRGVAVGPGERGGEGAPGQQVLQVYVAEPLTADQVRALLVDAMDVRLAGDVPLQVIHAGIIRAKSGAFRTRPAPGGISVGHFQDKKGFGTLGCLATGRSGDAAGKLFCLSCNHVLALSNSAQLGDCIVQPGPGDGGSCPSEQIAVLENYGILDFSGKTNYVDCAIGWCFPDRVTKSLFHIVNGVVQYFGISSQTRVATPNMWVGKMGRTTQLTYGRVTSTTWSGKIDYDDGDEAYFDRQIAITNPGYNFCLGGDSGSIIWTGDSATNPVGLLFAGDDAAGTTFANPIDWVLSTLNINLST
ncbi:hypothetical protein BEK98_27765 [Streptomyces diastatochromogenes]|uniref:Peptidase S1 domain-containing protein n=2 Tax=Streptomyces diastatochromogenes TaxID=42236 RepID=A0A233S8A0_STRDA|nr:hypothetical protein BEK98_27765 [Streptomyces diastatochromogenes]